MSSRYSKEVLDEVKRVQRFLARTNIAIHKKVMKKVYEGKRGWDTDLLLIQKEYERHTKDRDYLDIAITAMMIYDWQKQRRLV